jgi:hypothetical protein
VGELQHLLHPGPGGRRRGGGSPRHAGQPAGRPGLRLEGRDPGGVLVVHRRSAGVATGRISSSTTGATPPCWSTRAPSSRRPARCRTSTRTRSRRSGG